MLKKSVSIFFLVMYAISFPTAQQAIAPGQDLEELHLQLAVSSRDYPVTLGDLYQLSYRSTSGTMINMDVQIDGSGIVSLGVFGKQDANGLTFVQLKQKVEDLISRNYSHSLPELKIISPGVFRVTVRDGSSRIQYATAWGLSRLSEIVDMFATSSTSMRNVELVALSGSPVRYDLLKAGFSNESGLDPLVKPGDTIILHAPTKLIKLSGEVRRPGFYELMGQEGLRELVEKFGGGLTNQADGSRVRIDRSTAQTGRTEYVALPEGYSASLALNDGDSVLIRARDEQLSVIWFEGAVIEPTPGAVDGPTWAGTAGNAPSAQSAAAAASQGAVGSSSGTAGAAAVSNGRFAYKIREGQMLSDVLQDVRPYFQPLADLGFASVFFSSDSIQDGTHVDIPALLSGSDMSTDLALSAGYRVIIPTVGVTVMVSGAVYAPGPVPYRPNAPATYYMIQAGGVDPWRNTLRFCDVFDQYGRKRKSSEKIQPGDQVHVRENDFGYQLERRVPVIASVLALATSIITLTIVYGQ